MTENLSAKDTGESVKPPVGIMPRHLWVDGRIYDICAAIVRYKESGTPIPEEWHEELVELSNWRTKEMGRSYDRMQRQFQESVMKAQQATCNHLVAQHLGS